MHVVAVLLLSLGINSVAIQALSLLDALRQANASTFADQIESDPNISALYLNVKTVFAPVDFIGTNRSLSHNYLRVRAPGDERKHKFQIAKDLANANDLNQLPAGKPIPTENESNLLNGDPRVNVVSHPIEDNNNNNNNNNDNNSNNEGSVVRRQENADNLTTIPPQRIKISSGLGKNVSIIRGDIPYDGGIIHLVDGYFTQPKALSATSSETNNTQFASRLSRSNLTSLLDKTPSITVFIPSDAAFAAATAGNNNRTNETTSQISSQLLGHVLVDQVLYLPSLVDGATYKTKAGTTITISVRGGRYFVNGVLIVQSNFIIENGVAHILNKVLPARPASPSPPIITGSSSSTFNPTIPTIISILNACCAMVFYTLS